MSCWPFQVASTDPQNALHRGAFLVPGGLGLLASVESREHALFDPAKITAEHLALAAALGTPWMFEIGPKRCWGVNLGDFCPCEQHTADRDARTAVRALPTPRQPWELREAA